MMKIASSDSHWKGLACTHCSDTSSPTGRMTPVSAWSLKPGSPSYRCTARQSKPDKKSDKRCHNDHPHNPVTAMAVHRQGKTSGSCRHRPPGGLSVAGAISSQLSGLQRRLFHLTQNASVPGFCGREPPSLLLCIATSPATPAQDGSHLHQECLPPIQVSASH